MKDKPWRVTNPHGIVWNVQFITEESAWCRVAVMKMRPSDATIQRLRNAGWKVEKMDG